MSSSGHVLVLWFHEGAKLWVQVRLEVRALSLHVSRLHDLQFGFVVSERQFSILETGQGRFEMVLWVPWKP